MTGGTSSGESTPPWAGRVRAAASGGSAPGWNRAAPGWQRLLDRLQGAAVHREGGGQTEAADLPTLLELNRRRRQRSETPAVETAHSHPVKFPDPPPADWRRLKSMPAWEMMSSLYRQLCTVSAKRVEGRLRFCLYCLPGSNLMSISCEGRDFTLRENLRNACGELKSGASAPPQCIGISLGVSPRGLTL
jgi:hypothetical protein